MGKAVLWAAILSPALLYLVSLPDFGRLQYYDYYGIILDITDGEKFVGDPRAWLGLKSNEHTVTLPALAYAANLYLTDGDNRGLSALALLLLFITFILVWRMLPEELRQLPWPGFPALLILSLFVFTPVVAHNVVMGFSGTMWFMANAFAVGAISCLTRETNDIGRRGVGSVVLLGIGATLSFSTSLSLWPSLLFGAGLTGLRFRRLLVLAIAAVGVYALYFATYESVPYHPSPNVNDYSLALRYGFVYLGLLFTADIGMAGTLGALVLGYSILLFVMVMIRGDRALRIRLAPWWMIQLYALGNCLGTAVGRSGLGLDQALSPRYASLCALFWIGALAASGILLVRQRASRRFLRLLKGCAPLLLVAILAYFMNVHGIGILKWYLERASAQPLAEFALRHGFRDAEAALVVVPGPAYLWKSMDFLTETGHVPFDKPKDPRFGKKLGKDHLRAETSSVVTGSFDELEAYYPPRARVWGWAHGQTSDVAEILIVNESGIVRGKAFVELPEFLWSDRSDLYETGYGWRGYAIALPGENLRACARLSGDTVFYLLPGTL